VEGEPVSRGESVRIDLWAWSVRLYKTRDQAAAACKKAQLLVNGQRCRAAKQVRIGDEICVKQGLLLRTLEVKGILRRRVAAKEVAGFLQDLTSEAEYRRVAEIEKLNRDSTPQREAGAGRPTKRDRREIEEISPLDPGEAPSFEDFVKAFMRRR